MVVRIIALLGVTALLCASAALATEVRADRFPHADAPKGGMYMALGLSGNHQVTVGNGIAIGDVCEFYYTVDASCDPPFYQRYRFYAEGDAFWFYHETREGNSWPQTQAAITASGTVKLTEAEWEAFFGLIAGGTVKDREENLDDGDDGPWMYLYWNGDRGQCQEYAFIDYGARLDFEAFCGALASRGETADDA